MSVWLVRCLAPAVAWLEKMSVHCSPPPEELVAVPGDELLVSKAKSFDPAPEVAAITSPAVSTVPTVPTVPAVCTPTVNMQLLKDLAGQCVLLFTSLAGSRPVREVESRRTRLLLNSKKIDFVEIDGALPEHRQVREALWQLAGTRSYPLIFLDQTLLGGYEVLEQLLECNAEDGMFDKLFTRWRQRPLDEQTAATRIEAAARAMRVRMSLAVEHEAASALQALFRGMSLRRRLFRGEHQNGAAVEHEAASMLQAMFRGSSLRRQLVGGDETQTGGALEHKAASTLQAVFRGTSLRRRLVGVENQTGAEAALTAVRSGSFDSPSPHRQSRKRTSKLSCSSIESEGKDTARASAMRWLMAESERCDVQEKLLQEDSESLYRDRGDSDSLDIHGSKHTGLDPFCSPNIVNGISPRRTQSWNVKSLHVRSVMDAAARIRVSVGARTKAW
ncbi:hypothetical protein AB1Y20_000002 [Prymnesium parvum]|uniref:Glutaredoxin domain-containing protein n=1 Tax=Prymnesium parvum TaxID=97485 RepID=A0AB34K546_PRYPA